MIFDRRTGSTAVCLTRRFESRVIMLVLAVALLVIGGCGTTTPLVKKEREIKVSPAKFVPGSETAQSKKAPAPKLATYPGLPTDEDGPRVRRFVREYAYKQRETMKQYLAAGEQHLPMVKAVAAENGLPEDIAYLVMLESGGNPEARSPANALGMWQFMAATARNYGLRVDSWVDERLDPEASTKAAMLYLKDLYGMFGCWRLALSAYNSGENKLNKVLCQEDANEYDEICSSPRLRRETREFWPRFQAIARIAQNPEKYGFSPLKLKAYSKSNGLVSIEGSYSLQKLGQMAGVPAEDLLDLNPSLIQGKTPPDGPPYSVKVPRDKKELLVARLKDAPPEDPKEHVVHVVNKGDSVRKILSRYKVSKSELATSNPDVNLRRRLRTGDKIVIPVEKKKTDRKFRNGTEKLSALH